MICKIYDNDFYPRPPGGGRPAFWRRSKTTLSISIHALWVEGDISSLTTRVTALISIHALRVEGDASFMFAKGDLLSISIHALRVEGDVSRFIPVWQLVFISIHALRVEGDY